MFTEEEGGTYENLQICSPHELANVVDFGRRDVNELTDRCAPGPLLASSTLNVGLSASGVEKKKRSVTMR